MAVVRKRGDLQWQAIVRKKGSPEVYKTFEQKADAVRWAKTVELAIERGEIDSIDQRTQKITVGEVIDEYTRIKLPTLVGPGMRKIELARIDKAFGPLYIANLRAPVINQWVLALADQPPGSKKKLSPGTVTHHINRLSGLVEFARRHMGVYIPENPVRLVTRPKLTPGRTRRLREQEEARLLECAQETPRLPQLITLALETAMRLGELLALRWEFVDLQAQTAHVPLSKNGEARTVALSKAAVAAFKYLKRTKVTEINGKVFHWARSDSVTHTWTRLIKRAQACQAAAMQTAGALADQQFLVDLRFHDLRHEGTSRLFEKGLGLMEVASMTGHKNIAMLKRYTHIGAQNLAKKLG